MSRINTLTEALFDTLQAVKTGTMEIDRAKAVCEVSQQLINVAKVEIDYAKANGADITSSFIETHPPRLTGQPPAKPSLASQMEAAGRKSA